MQTKFRKLLAVILVVCLLVTTMSVPTFAANGTATLSAYTMTESGSITVTFSQTATSSAYYNVQIADSSWSNKYVDTNITSGTTYTISGYSAGTYQIYIGYWENGSWVSNALSTTTFTVTEDGSTTYGLSLAVSDSAPALGDSVTVTASFTVDGVEQSTIPSDCYLSIWYQHDSDWVTPVNGSDSTTSTTISVSSSYFTEGTTYTVQAGLYDSTWNTLASASVTFTPGGTSAGGTGTSSTTYGLSLSIDDSAPALDDSVTVTATFTVDGTEQSTIPSDCYLSIWYQHDSDWVTPVNGSSSTTSTTISVSSTYFTEGTTYTVQAGLYDSTWNTLASASVTFTPGGTSTGTASEEITTGSIDSCDFIRGMDLSTFYTNWTNGAVYYDYDGNEYSQSKGNAVEFFEFLYDECGVNWVRLRVWNDPYDSDGNPYGGGNNNVEVAKIIGQWASEAGMTLLIDFHYSDFWADPGRQLAPKAWSSMTIDEKADALYTYTYDSLVELIEAGLNIGMVQVGNETNGSFCGEAITTWANYDTNEGWQNMVTLFKSGSAAVRQIAEDYGMTIKVALHFTNPNNSNPSWYAGLLDDADVDYDAIGISYYMYWHGTLSNLESEISTIYNTYGKEVFIAETAYPYTSDNYDSLGNQVTSFSDFDYNSNLYAISEAGQEAALTAILGVAATTEGCFGMFYWEPAWTALDSSTLDNGTGWATKWAGDYISYSMSASEGSSFDNQTLFDSDGNALAGLSFYADYMNGVSLTSVEHTWDSGEVTRQATDSQSGIITYTCTECKETKIVLFSLGEYASFYTRTLTLDGSIGVNYYVNMYDLDADEMEKYTVVFYVDDAEYYTASFDSTSCRSDFGDGNTYYRFTVNLDSTQMATSFTAKLMYDGKLVAHSDTYSVRTYCERAIKGSWDEKALCEALLNYGAYAQTYFGENTDDLANSTIGDCDNSWSDPVTSTFSADLSGYTTTTDISEISSDISDPAISLVLKSKTLIRLYFNSSNTSNLTFTVDDETLTITTVDSSSDYYGTYGYYVEFKVPAGKLSDTYTIDITGSSGTGTVTYSAYAYIYTTLNDSTSSDALKNVCKALYYYGVAADSYTNWYSGS